MLLLRGQELGLSFPCISQATWATSILFAILLDFLGALRALVFLLFGGLVIEVQVLLLLLLLLLLPPVVLVR